MRQRVPGHDITSVAGYGDISRVDPDTHLGNRFEGFKIVFADPTVARRQINEPSVRRVLGAAVQSEPGFEAPQRLKTITVENRYVVVSGLNHRKQVHRIGIMNRRLAKRRQCVMHHPAGINFGKPPSRNIGQWTIDKICQCRDVFAGELCREPRHLCRHASVCNRRDGVFLLQAFQVFGEQGRSDPA